MQMQKLERLLVKINKYIGGEMRKHLLSFFLLSLDITGATHLPEIFPYRENRSLRELLAIATFGCSFTFGEPHRTSCSPVRRPLFLLEICAFPLRGKIYISPSREDKKRVGWARFARPPEQGIKAKILK